MKSCFEVKIRLYKSINCQIASRHTIYRKPWFYPQNRGASCRMSLQHPSFLGRISSMLTPCLAESPSIPPLEALNHKFYINDHCYVIWSCLTLIYKYCTSMLFYNQKHSASQSCFRNSAATFSRISRADLRMLRPFTHSTGSDLNL